MDLAICQQSTYFYILHVHAKWCPWYQLFTLLSTRQILLEYYNSSLEEDGASKEIVNFGAVASICGGLEANYNNAAPKVMYYSARGPDPVDSFPHEADIMKPNLVAPGNSIWAAWSSLATDSDEFLGL